MREIEIDSESESEVGRGGADGGVEWVGVVGRAARVALVHT